MEAKQHFSKSVEDETIVTTINTQAADTRIHSKKEFQYSNM